MKKPKRTRTRKTKLKRFMPLIKKSNPSFYRYSKKRRKSGILQNFLWKIKSMIKSFFAIFGFVFFILILINLTREANETGVENAQAMENATIAPQSGQDILNSAKNIAVATADDIKNNQNISQVIQGGEAVAKAVTGRATPQADNETVKPFDMSCRIIGVSDGDTATCLTNQNQQVKIRFANIDAPESKQAFGTRSKQALSDFIFDKTVQLKIHNTDRYGRQVAEVYLDGMNVNKQMVKQGYAWAYKEYLTDKHYLELQDAAKRFNEGLWVDKNPVYPQDWRRQQKELRDIKRQSSAN